MKQLEKSIVDETAAGEAATLHSHVKNSAVAISNKKALQHTALQFALNILSEWYSHSGSDAAKKDVRQEVLPVDTQSLASFSIGENLPQQLQWKTGWN